ncbi:MAG: hypothetical protein ABFQ53_03625 [Patescibacteria group bacterium]
MIAMFILVIGIIGAVFLSAKSTAQISDSRNAIVAMSLAQEGAELVRNIRDNSVTQKTCGSSRSERCTAFDQSTGYKWPSGNGYGCVVDHSLGYPGGDPMNCLAGRYLEDIYLNESTGFYEHAGGGEDTTLFKRIVYIDYFDVDTEIEYSSTTVPQAGESGVDQLAAKITSVVTWRNNDDIDLKNKEQVEENCLISNQCAYAQTTLTSWLNYD